MEKQESQTQLIHGARVLLLLELIRGDFVILRRAYIEQHVVIETVAPVIMMLADRIPSGIHPLQFLDLLRHLRP